ncbi:MAG: adenylosuccinate synthetase [Bacilli bacterium]
MSQAFIVGGSQFGDEGKGTLCDYLTSKYNIHENVRYNGGSQASHTVVNDKVSHKFSQLGSSSLNNDTKTYLSSNTIVNPFNIVTEAKVLSLKLGNTPEEILSNIYIDKDALIVTPYHSLLNKLRELSSKNNRIGSVGSGVSEVNRLKDETGIYITISDLYTQEYRDKLLELFDYTCLYLRERRNLIDDKLFNELISKEDLFYLTDKRNREYIISCYSNLIDSDILNIIDGISSFHEKGNILFEGSQGLLLDKNYGIRPNVTSLDTTNKYGCYLSKELNIKMIKYGCIGAYNSRHGMGLLPTYDKSLEIKDLNQTSSYYQGSPRYGWFDCVLTRYSQNILQNDYLFMSCIDNLSKFKEIKICDSYTYYGQIDEEFKNTFEYYVDSNRIIIKNIKRNSYNLRYYLSRCIPNYIIVKGWNIDISDIKDVEKLPSEVNDYISLIEYLTNTHIPIIGVGPSRDQKLERKIL